MDSLLNRAKHQFDLTSAQDQRELMDLTLALQNETPTVLMVKDAARQAPLEFQLAAKLWESKQQMAAVNRPLKVGVVFAMWGEQARLQPKSEDNPAGEDALRTKMEQLNWICSDSAVDWHLYAVDDGDPADSGSLARSIADSHELGHKVTVQWLSQELPSQAGPLANLNSPDDSRKGGAIILGAQQAINDGCEAVVYTDADNSVHLGQLGLLLKPYIEGASMVLGNRKHAESVLVKAGDRWGIGIKALRHMQRMVGNAIFSLGLNDTQAAFKLYDSLLLKDIIAAPTVYDFSFDTDWIAAAVARQIPFVQVPFAFIDSAEESASAKQNPMTTWETLLLGMLKSLKNHNLLQSEEARAMAQVIEAEVKDYRDLEMIINDLPPELAQASEDELGLAETMSPTRFQEWMHSLRG